MINLFQKYCFLFFMVKIGIPLKFKVFISLYVLYSSPQQYKIIKSLYTKEKKAITNKLKTTKPKYIHSLDILLFLIIRKLYTNTKGSKEDSNNALDIGE